MSTKKPLADATEGVDPETGQPRTERKTGSYTSRVMGAFFAVASMTVLIIVVVLASVWNTHFRDYTHDSMQNLAASLAESIGYSYGSSASKDEEWDLDTLACVNVASDLFDTWNIRVEDEKGAVVYDNDQTSSKLFGPQKGGESVASAPIMVKDEQVGTVYVRVFGSTDLSTALDREFQSRSYQAIVLAGLIALIAALIVGFLFSRALVRPINGIAHAANRIKEGDYSARSGLSGNDEISRLGETFDRMAESIEANRDLERRLVTDVAHELRTPLMAIQATVEAIIDGVYEPSPERLETLNSEVRRLSRLVDALLKLSRLENRANPVEMTRLDLSELLETVAESHKAFVVDSGLNFEFRRDPHVYILGNADMIRQATANLISNAVRYTPEGGTVTLSVKKGDIMGQIAVSDTGIGLTPEEAKMVFSRFWRADRGRARDTGGLGIGLSVVKEIVDRHNGWVHVDGRPNEGACFTIYIPLIREQERPRRLRIGRENPKNLS
ncbi:MAG: ATP-binding protein [Coriobacteriia bacterium]|nr:ATP-binding protein [Coriobacteriia bacterium]